MLARNGSAGVASSSERVVGASGLSSSGTRKVDVVLVGESEKVGLSVCVCPFYQVFESKFVYAIGADIDSTSRAAKLHVEEGDILAAVNGTSLLTSDQPFEVFRDIIVKTRPVTLTFISPDSFPLHPLARMIKHYVLLSRNEDEDRGINRPLSRSEKRVFRSMVQMIAAGTEFDVPSAPGWKVKKGLTSCGILRHVFWRSDAMSSEFQMENTDGSGNHVTALEMEDSVSQFLKKGGQKTEVDLVAGKKIEGSQAQPEAFIKLKTIKDSSGREIISLSSDDEEEGDTEGGATIASAAEASEQKRSLKFASVEQKRYLKAQIQKRKLESAEKLRQEILLSAEHMKQCESVLEYVVSEVEERYWEEHVPQSNPDALYAGSLRFLANVLNQSRIVNRPKTQAMYAYASLARQWHDNYLDRIRSAPELMSKVAASQVLYFDGLRFSEYEFVAQVLPSLKAQLLTSLKELDEAIGSGAAWAQYQKDICASGISRLATNKDLEDLQENYSALIYKKPMERFTKRIKQNYKARGGQPAFIPKHRTQEGRNSLKKVWAMRNSGSSNGTSSLEKKLALADKAVKKQKQEAKLEARRARQNAAHAVRREVKIIERAEAAKVSKKPAFPVVNVEGVGTRRVVTYVGGERVLPRGMDGNSDPRKGRQWGLGLPYVSVTLNRDRTDPAMKPYVTNRDAKPKRRRVVCVLNGKRVSFPSDN